MTRTMTVNKWGNSLGIRFPNEFVEKAGIKEKCRVELQTDGNKLIITKLEEPRKRMTIMERFEMFPADFIQEDELDWGEDVGEEIICD